MNDTDTTKIDEKREQMAEILLEAMSNRKLTEFDTGSGTITVTNGYANGNNHYSTLHFEDSGDLDSVVGDDDDFYYMYGDFSHSVSRCTPEEVLGLLEVWDDIVAAFTAYDKKVEELCEKELQTI